MKRTEFMTMGMKAGACCAAAVFLQNEAVSVGQAALKTGQQDTSNERTIQFARQWIKRFMDILDAQLDEGARKKLMEENGRLCFCGSHGEFDPSTPQPDPDRWIAGMQEKIGPENIRREGDVFFFNYFQDDHDRKIPNRHCLCPLVQDSPAGLSATYCHCSIGYVRELFRRVIRRPLEVELLASIHHGDDGCRFKVLIMS
jgi:hypothetical protein